MIIFMTGGTGFLGKYLIKELLSENHFIYLLVRPQNYERYEKIYRDYQKIKLVKGDITDPKLIFEKREMIDEVLEQTDAILHLAALYDLREKEFPLYLHNVVGTQNLLSFIQTMKKRVFFHYMSTIAVAGDYFGTFYEDEIFRHQKFHDFYAETKFKTELYLRNWNEKSDLLKRVYRLGILVGDSISGEMEKIDGPYYFLETLKKIKKMVPYLSKIIKYLPFPYSESSSLPLLPVDEAAKMISIMVSNPVESSHYRCYHLISRNPPSVRGFILDALNKIKMSPYLLALPKSSLNNKIYPFLKIPKEVENYLYSECEFDQTQFKKDFPFLLCKEYDEYKNSLFSFLDRIEESEG